MLCLRDLLKSASAVNSIRKSVAQHRPFSLSFSTSFFFCNTNNKSATNNSSNTAIGNGVERPNLNDIAQTIKDYEATSDKSQFSNEQATSILKAYINLGRNRDEKASLEESADRLKSGLELATKKKLLGSIEAGELGNSLAGIYIKQQKSKEARITLDKAREAFSRHAKTGVLNSGFLENIYLRALLLVEQKHASDAAELLEEYIFRVEKLDTVEGDNFDVYLLYDKLGDIIRNTDDFEPSINHWKKCSETIKEKYGESSEKLIPVYEKIAEAMHTGAKYEEAAVVTEESLKICMKVYGEDSIEVAKHYFLLGSIYYEQEVYSSALDSYKQCLNSDMISSADYVEEVTYAYLSIARLYDIVQDSVKSEEYFDKGLKYLSKNFGENSAQVVDYYLGWAGLIEGKPEKVTNYKNTLVKVVESSKKCSYSDKGVISDVYYDLGEINYKEGNIDQALKYYEDGLQNASKEPKDALAVEKAHNAIGLVLYKQEKFSESVDNFKKAIETCFNPLISQNLDMYYRNLGLALEGVGNEKEAVEYFERALGTAVNRFGKNSKIVREYFEILVDRYARVERFDDITQLREELYPQ